MTSRRRSCIIATSCYPGTATHPTVLPSIRPPTVPRPRSTSHASTAPYSKGNVTALPVTGPSMNLILPTRQALPPRLIAVSRCLLRPPAPSCHPRRPARPPAISRSFHGWHP
ncbi:hypothetical protein BDR03DRAFT_971501, partial [Suillus americanus]